MGRLEELEDRLTTLEDAVCYKLDAGAFEKLSRRVCALEAKEYNLDREVLRQPITAKDIDRWRDIEKAAIEAAKAWDEGRLFEPPEKLEPDRRLYRSSVLGRLREAVK